MHASKQAWLVWFAAAFNVDYLQLLRKTCYILINILVYIVVKHHKTRDNNESYNVKRITIIKIINKI